MLVRKLGLNREIEAMIAYLERYLSGYEITVKGAQLCFHSNEERFYVEFPVRLMLEMYRADQLLYMFLMPAIVPH